METLPQMRASLDSLKPQLAQVVAELARDLDVLLIAGGAITSVPLMCFAAAVIRLPLVIAGLFQYLAPTLSLLLAIFVFGEPFSVIQLVSFSCVWVALALFTAESLYQFKRAQARLHSASEAKP